MKRRSGWIVAGLITLAAGSTIRAQEATSPDPYANETKEQRDARMAWWREAKFGMFIHWGVYAVPAGTYDGKQIGGIGEWIMNRGKIPVARYKAYAPQFTASNYDPQAWVRVAKNAGMRYIVITSKHHDGFALFATKASDWNAVDAGGAKRDLIAPLAKAARAEGLKFGLYYSQAQDWTNPGGAKAGYKEGESWDTANKGDFDAYLRTIAAPQVKEILSQYKPDILWWDTPTWMNKERAELLIPYLKLVPGIIHNNRLGGGYNGDTETPEQHIPATGFKDRDWEVCMTMNNTWGYKSYDHNWKSVADLIHKLCDIVSKGGNFLLNVGPTAEGEIPQPSIERLEAVGAWMKVNGEAIYGTTASPFLKLPWGRCTKKLRPDGATLYLHVFDWPKDGKLELKGLKNAPRSAVLLAGMVPLKVEKTGEGVVIAVPEAAPDSIASVIKLEVDGALEVEAVTLEQGADGKILLNAALAEINNPGYGAHMQLEQKGPTPNLGFWTDARAWVQWTYRVSKPGDFSVSIELAGLEKTPIEWSVDGKKQKATIEPTGDYETFKTVELGRAAVEQSGVHTFSIRPVADGWKPLNVRSVTFTPAQ